MSTYNPPKWMADPRNKIWKLDEIKNGVVVDSHELNASLVTFGRTPEIKGAHAFITAHESCSRLHARIAFDSTGTPWLRDLGSGNGTKGTLSVEYLSTIALYTLLLLSMSLIYFKTKYCL
jgi:hypothetical protein